MTSRKQITLPIVLAVLTLGTLVAYRASRSPQAHTAAAPSAVAAPSQERSPEVGPKAVLTHEKRAGHGERSVTKTGASQSTASAPSRSAVGTSEANSGSTVVAAGLLSRLSQLDLSRGVMTREQAKELNQSFKQLAAQGAAAVPVIRQFLERNQDLMFNAVNGGDLADYPSLRLGLFDVLKQVGGPEAVEVSRETLRTTADPLEIAMLARNLETLDPGQDQQAALNAAREALALAAAGQLGASDVGPLFAVLQTYGDASVVADLEKALPQWDYYAAMALAGLPDGQGIAALIRQAQDPAQAGKADTNIPLQMLAQVATQYPEAAAALLEEARSNQIPDSAWNKIAMGLAGAQYQLTNPLRNVNFPPVARAGFSSHHIHDGNQNFYSTSARETGQPLGPRLTLIDQLLAATSNPAAVQALQEARAALSGN